MAILLQEYNKKLRTIKEIWTDLKWSTPFIVRKPGHASGFAVLVAQFREDAACGYPIINGKKTHNNWCPVISVGPQNIPSAETPEWVLVDLPFADVEEALATWASSQTNKPQMKLELSSDTAVAERETLTHEESLARINEILYPADPAKTEASLGPLDRQIYNMVRDMQAKEAVTSKSSIKEIEAAFGHKTLPFGRYAGLKIKDVIKKNDIGYVRWAIDNIRSIHS